MTNSVSQTREQYVTGAPVGIADPETVSDEEQMSK